MQSQSQGQKKILHTFKYMYKVIPIINFKNFKSILKVLVTGDKVKFFVISLNTKIEH